MRKIILTIIIVAAVLVAGVIYFTYDPSKEGNLFPRCIFVTLTGFKCPGCGSQRAIHALLHGDIITVAHYNAAMLVGIPLAIAYGIAEWKRTTWQRYYLVMNNRWVLMTILVAIRLWWVLRNILGL